MSFATQNLIPTVGEDGRIRNVRNQVICNGPMKWRVKAIAKVIHLPYFGMPFDQLTQTVQAPTVKGPGKTSIELQGLYNFDPTAATETGTTGITRGMFVLLDLFDSKTRSTGYASVNGTIESFDHGVEIGGGVATFTATLVVNGVMPTWGTIES